MSSASVRSSSTTTSPRSNSKPISSKPIGSKPRPRSASPQRGKSSPTSVIPSAPSYQNVQLQNSSVSLSKKAKSKSPKKLHQPLYPDLSSDIKLSRVNINKWLNQNNYTVEYVVVSEGNIPLLLKVLTVLGSSTLFKLYHNANINISSFKTIKVHKVANEKSHNIVAKDIESEYSSLGNLETGFAFITPKGIHSVERFQTYDKSTNSSTYKVIEKSYHIIATDTDRSNSTKSNVRSDICTVPYVRLEFMYDTNRNRTTVDLISCSNILKQMSHLIDISCLRQLLKYYNRQHIIFVPIDSSTSWSNTIKSGVSSIDTAINILLYHIVISPNENAVPKPLGIDIKNSTKVSYQTLQGDSIIVDGVTGTVNDTAKILKVDGAASNGYVHFIDKLLIPKQWNIYKGLKRDKISTMPVPANKTAIIDITTILPVRSVPYITLTSIINTQQALRKVSRKMLQSDLTVIISDVEIMLASLHNIAAQYKSSEILLEHLYACEYKYNNLYYGVNRGKLEKKNNFKAPYFIPPVILSSVTGKVDKDISDSDITTLKDDAGHNVTLERFLTEVANGTKSKADRYKHSMKCISDIASLRKQMDTLLDSFKNTNINMALLPNKKQV